MIEGKKKCQNGNQGKAIQKKSTRLALALRENLKKRKYQKRLRATAQKDNGTNHLLEE